MDEQTGVICLVIMFALTFMVFEMSETVNFLNFLSIAAKRLPQFGQHI